MERVSAMTRETKDPVDRRIEELRTLARRRGFKFARTEAAITLAAIAIWLDQECGPKPTYHFLQSAADSIAAPLLSAE
jgi:hypothetical protein